jgi:hypothetical protein
MRAKLTAVVKQKRAQLAIALLDEEKDPAKLTELAVATVLDNEYRIGALTVERNYSAMTMRAEIKRFGGFMELLLQQHDPNRASRWKGATPEQHMEKARHHLGLAMAAKKDGKPFVKHLINAANYVMFAVDGAGYLEE